MMSRARTGFFSASITTLCLLPAATQSYGTEGVVHAVGCSLRTAKLYDKYKEVEATYQRKMREALSRNHTKAELREITKEWQSGLSDLASEAAKLDAKQLSAEDLSALAMTAEHFQKRDDCIRFARLAIAKNPSIEEAYPPLVRTLLNEDDPEAAALIMEKAKQKCDRDSKIFALHYIVYHKAANDGKNRLALRQIRIYAQWLSERLSYDADSVVQLHRHVSDYVRAHKNCGATKELQEGSDLLHSKIEKAIQHNIDSRKQSMTKRERDIENGRLRELEVLKEEVKRISELTK